MSRRHLFAWMILCLALFIGSCSEKLDLMEAQIQTPESLTATVDDPLLFVGTFLGDGSRVARYNWDFESDGIFDYESVNSSGGNAGSDTTVHAYDEADDYTATLQITTVDNQLFRGVTQVHITDELPVITASVTEAVDCGDDIELSGSVSDDAGLRAFWDFDNDGTPEISEIYTDSITLTATLNFDAPGIYPVSFGASDNDGHIERREFEITVGVAPQWTEAQAMSQPRADHAGVTHGGEIYIFGGRDGSAALGSVEIYDPVSDAWRFASDMPTPRWGLEAAVVRDSIYVVGGVTAAGEIFDRVEIYDPATDTWRTFPADAQHQMAIPKLGFSMLRLGENFAGGDSLLLFGGLRDAALSDTLVIYNTRVDTFSLDKVTGHYLQRTRAWMGAVTAWEDEAELRGQIMAVGGSEDGATASSGFEFYIPANDFWTREQALPTARIAPAVAHHEGKVYVFGGSTGSLGVMDDLEIYTLDQERWQPGEAMPLPRSSAAALTLDDRIFVVGGATELSSPWYVQGSAEVQVLLPLELRTLSPSL